MREPGNSTLSARLDNHYVYEISTSTVGSMEAMINIYTKKWLGFLPGLSDVALYCRQAKSKLPFKSIVEEFKSGTPNDAG